MENVMSSCEYFDAAELAFLREAAEGTDDGWAASCGLAETAAELASLVLSDDPAGFALALERSDATSPRLLAAEGFCRLVLLGLSYGVARGDAACANHLGALYYLGRGVPQDYRRARELYELADSRGHVRAMVNLGYVFEYGRTGEPDYGRAYRQYAKAAALSGHFEALYKLGDLYYRGRGVARDRRTALALWGRSLREAEGEPAQAQPAFRIARLVSDPASADAGLPFDPMGALRLFQLAERGLRVSVARGEAYYEGRLREAVEGQERMRAVLEGPGGDRFLA